ncbi:cysteine proteinase [Phlebopus sp. FC_14]|nr:cysteine proteinase [Phlebopus sp. FC_14]
MPANARKRQASDSLLPTRLAKHPRKDNSPGLVARWRQLASDALNLGCETFMAFLPTPNDDEDTARPTALAPTQSLHSAPTRTVLPSRYPIPRECHPSGDPPSRPHDSHLSSSLPSNSDSLITSNSNSTSLRSAITTGQTSIESKPISVPGDKTMDDVLEEFIRKSQRANKMHPMLSHRRSREHIFARVHKAKVLEDRKQDREDMLKELYHIKRTTGYTSDFEAFKSYLNYQARLELLDKQVLSPSPSLTDLRLKERTPGLTHRHSFSDDVNADFLERAIRKAKQSFASPPPKPFSTYDLLRLSERKKDEAIEQRLRPSLPKSLPPDLDQEVDALLSKKGIISRVAREQVCDKDLSRLAPHQWLNDEIINFYGAMILMRSEACKENPVTNGTSGGRKKPLNVHYFNTFFWSKLQGEGYERARLAKWTKKFDIFAKDAVLIPINHNNSHWTGGAINFRRKRIELYDSMNLDRRHIFKVLRHYLDLEHQNKKKKPFNFSGWEDYYPDDTPQQENGFDCGVFTCQFLESLSRGEESFNFSQRDMRYLRRRMIWEIGHAKFLEGP